LEVAISTVTQGNCGAQDDWQGTLKIAKKLDCDLENCDLSDGLISTVELSSAEIK